MMTGNQIIGDLQNQIFASFGKRFFAWMMAQSSGTYDKIVGERKSFLFSSL